MIKIIKEVLGSALYSARLKFASSQEQMAERCSLSVRQYSDLENGKRLPSLRTFFNILITCELDANLLIKQIREKGYRVNNEKDAA